MDAAAALKPDLLKIRVDDNLGTDPKMSPEVYGAVIARARERGLRVAAHVYYLEDAKGVLRAGADFIAHSVRDRAVDDELVGLLKERDACLCPTLMREVSTFVYESEPAVLHRPVLPARRRSPTCWRPCATRSARRGCARAGPPSNTRRRWRWRSAT